MVEVEEKEEEEDGDMAAKALHVAALGRPFTLGMLYDARRDQLLPGVTLWDESTLAEMTLEEAQPGSDFKIAASDSLEQKSTLLDIEGSLKTSLFFGLVKAEGSGKFMSDVKSSRRQSRVSFQYKATTFFKQLKTSPKARKAQKLDSSVKSLATHVVTGILYGANAFFVFDSEKVDASSVMELEAKMKAVVNLISLFTASGVVDISLTEEQRSVAEKFSCKFYGDFILDSNPATFEDAVKTYVELPKLLGQSGENSVPLMVWMMPLKKMNLRAAEMVTEISPGLTMKAEDVLEGFNGLAMRSSDSLDDNNYFALTDDRFSSFQNLCKIFAASIQDKMAKTLPSVRAGKESEKALKKIFDDMEKSPFSLRKLTNWMDNTEREVSVARSCVEMMDEAKIMANNTEVVVEVLDPEVEDVLCFVFTSLETADPYLQELSDYLKSSGSKYTSVESPSTQDPWYLSSDVIIKMREKAKEFGGLARGLKNSSRYKFLVAAITNGSHQGASIYHYRNTVLLTEDFSRPAVTDVETITHKRDLMWYATDLQLDPDTVHPKLLLSEGNKKVTQGEVQLYPYSPQRFDHYVQVLGRDGLTGRHYWEVEWSVGYEQGVAVGVAYQGLFRTGQSKLCRLGYNVLSWCFGHNFPKTYAYHNGGLLHDEDFPEEGCTQVGVFLNWSAGTLSFYKVRGENLKHLYTFSTEFSEPVYPAFQTSADKHYVFLCL
ncbi:neoverrucotoxin subunit alpha-like [Xenentodon cancila]